MALTETIILAIANVILIIIAIFLFIRLRKLGKKGEPEIKQQPEPEITTIPLQAAELKSEKLETKPDVAPVANIGAETKIGSHEKAQLKLEDELPEIEEMPGKKASKKKKAAKKVPEEVIEKAVKEEIVPVELSTPEKEEGKQEKKAGKLDVKEIFKDFMAMTTFAVGEGIEEESVNIWQKARKEAKEKYGLVFSLENLKNLTIEDFQSFLYFRNNRAWTNLYRRGLEASQDIESLRKTLTFLQDESVDIKDRINGVLQGGSYHIKGFGKNIATGILHVCDKEDKYGVWNNRTEGGLQKLGLLPRRTYNKGDYYYQINLKLNLLKKELGTDLILVDCFMWYVDKKRNQPKKRKSLKGL